METLSVLMDFILPNLFEKGALKSTKYYVRLKITIF